MAEEQFTIQYIDDSGINRNILIRIDDNLALIRFHENINTIGEYQLSSITRVNDYNQTANIPGQARANCNNKYLDNAGNEIIKLGDPYSVLIPQDYNENFQGWSLKQRSASAINKMLAYQINSKDIFIVDGVQKPLYPLQFVDPCWADISFTEDTGSSDGTITVRPRAGTADFDVMLDNNSTWIPIVGLTYTFTGLPGAASAYTTPYRIDVRDSSSPVQRTKPVDNILL